MIEAMAYSRCMDQHDYKQNSVWCHKWIGCVALLAWVNCDGIIDIALKTVTKYLTRVACMPDQHLMHLVIQHYKCLNLFCHRRLSDSGCYEVLKTLLYQLHINLSPYFETNALSNCQFISRA